MSNVLVVVLSLNAILSMYLVINLWRKDEMLKTKINWSFVLFVPVLGALMFIVAFESHAVESNQSQIGNNTKISKSESINQAYAAHLEDDVDFIDHVDD